MNRLPPEGLALPGCVARTVTGCGNGHQLAFRNHDGQRFTLSVLTIGGGAVPVSGDLIPDCCFTWGSVPCGRFGRPGPFAVSSGIVGAFYGVKICQPQFPSKLMRA